MPVVHQTTTRLGRRKHCPFSIKKTDFLPHMRLHKASRDSVSSCVSGVKNNILQVPTSTCSSFNSNHETNAGVQCPTCQSHANHEQKGYATVLSQMHFSKKQLLGKTSRDSVSRCASSGNANIL